MLELMKPAGWEDKTEQELLQAIYKKHGENQRGDVRALLLFIEAFRKAHLTKPQKILYTFEADTHYTLGFSAFRVYFYDANNSSVSPIGVVAREHYRRTDARYAVHHRFNQSKKRALEIRRFNLIADTTKDLKRAVGIAVKRFLPLTETDIAVRTSGEARMALSRWASEPYKYSRLLDLEEGVMEMQNLVDQNVVFKSSAFKEAVERLPSMVEYYRREKIKNIPMLFVVEHGGLICTGRAEDTDSCRVVAKFSKPDDMPEALHAKYSLLRLIDENSHMPEVGYRDKGGVCWLFGVASQEFEQVLGLPSDC